MWIFFTLLPCLCVTTTKITLKPKLDLRRFQCDVVPCKHDFLSHGVNHDVPLPPEGKCLCTLDGQWITAISMTDRLGNGCLCFSAPYLSCTGGSVYVPNPSITIRPHAGFRGQCLHFHSSSDEKEVECEVQKKLAKVSIKAMFLMITLVMVIHSATACFLLFFFTILFVLFFVFLRSSSSSSLTASSAYHYHHVPTLDTFLAVTYWESSVSWAWSWFPSSNLLHDSF